MKNLDEAVKCSVTNKLCLTIRQAGEILNSFKHHQHGRRCKKDQMPKRKYFCIDCGFYHLTHLTRYQVNN